MNAESEGSMKMQNMPSPLAGLKVLDLSQIMAELKSQDIDYLFPMH